MDVVGIGFYTNTVISRFITIQVSLLIAFKTAMILTAELEVNYRFSIYTAVISTESETKPLKNYQND